MHFSTIFSTSARTNDPKLGAKGTSLLILMKSCARLMDIVRSWIMAMTLSNKHSVSDDKRSVSVATRPPESFNAAAARISVHARVTVSRRKSASPMILCSGVLRSCAWIVEETRDGRNK